jgi:hypothetical protein
MSLLHRRRLFAETPRRLLAAGGIALVLLLSVLAVNPELHRWIHGAADADHDHEDGCAVVLFAHGVSAPFDSAVLVATPAEWIVLGRPAAVEIFLTSPRYLLRPERGPPVS